MNLRHKRYPLWGVILVSWLIARPAHANIFGEDDRLDAYDVSAYQPVVKIQVENAPQYQAKFGNGAPCTGVLVSKNIVLTAAHCFEHALRAPTSDENRFTIPEKALSFVWVRYLAQEGKSAAKARMVEYVRGPTNAQIMKRLSPLARSGLMTAQLRLGHPDLHGDWALVHIDKPLGDHYGYLMLLTEVSNKDDLILPGYSMDKAGGEGEILKAHSGCHIRGRPYNGRMLYHDCDMLGGASGAPLLRCQHAVCEVVAVNTGGIGAQHAGEYVGPDPKGSNLSERTVNAAIPAKIFKKKWIELRARWE